MHTPSRTKTIAGGGYENVLISEILALVKDYRAISASYIAGNASFMNNLIYLCLILFSNHWL